MLEPKLEPMLEPKPPHESMSLHLALPEPEPIFLFQIRPEPKPCSGPCLNPSIHLNPCLFSKPCLNQCPCLDPCSCTKPCLNLKRTPEGMLFRTSHQPRGPGPPFWVALYGVTFFGGGCYELLLSYQAWRRLEALHVHAHGAKYTLSWDFVYTFCHVCLSCLCSFSHWLYSSHVFICLTCCLLVCHLRPVFFCGLCKAFMSLV